MRSDGNVRGFPPRGDRASHAPPCPQPSSIRAVPGTVTRSSGHSRYLMNSARIFFDSGVWSETVWVVWTVRPSWSRVDVAS